MNTFSKNLKKLITEQRITIAELSKKTGIPKTTLTEWRNGRKPTLSPELFALCKYYKTSIEELCQMINSPDSNSDSGKVVFKGNYKITLEKIGD